MIRSVLNSMPLRRRGQSVATPNRAKAGLYAGRGIGSGNQVSKFGNRTRRKWLPNVHRNSRFYSFVLQRHVAINCTSRAIRNIDKAGGFDNYMVHTNYKTMSPGGIGKGPEIRREILGVIAARAAAGEEPFPHIRPSPYEARLAAAQAQRAEVAAVRAAQQQQARGAAQPASE